MDNQELSYQNDMENTSFENVYEHYAPALQLKSDRGLLKFVLLTILTFGIYGIVTYSHISEELNIVASRYDGQRTMHYMLMTLLAPFTLGIYGLVWMHKLTKRVGAEVKRRGYDYQFGVKDFWLWNVLGSFIIVGPFIYCNKLLKSMNMINASYNYYG